MNSSWYEKREKNLAKELERINNTVAKLFLFDIRSMSLESDIHPTENEIPDIKTCGNLLPESLRKFVEVLIKGRLKKSSIGQVRISAVRPRSAVLPITFGLRPEIVDMFGSRWLINCGSLIFLFPIMQLSVTNNQLHQMMIRYVQLQQEKQTSSSGLWITLITIFQY